MSGKIIEDELKDVRDRLEKLVRGAEIIGCHRQNTQIRLMHTPHKQVVCQFQFLDGYPDVPILIELKSKVFSARVLDIMSKRLDEEVKKLVGRPQCEVAYTNEIQATMAKMPLTPILDRKDLQNLFLQETCLVYTTNIALSKIISVMKFLSMFFEDTPLLVCSEEISRIKKELVKEQDDFKLKQKAGQVSYRIVQDKYYLDIRVVVPDLYPTECVSVEYKDSNFPTLLQRHFVAQSMEMARQCVQPPLRKNPKAPPFEPKASLWPVIHYLVSSVRKYPKEVCQVCKKQALAETPSDNQSDTKSDNFVEWVYCGHLFHHSCLDTYMKTPPFTGGKKCQGCGKRIYHDKWNVTPKLAEDRWAHKEARNREINEVADFLDLS